MTDAWTVIAVRSLGETAWTPLPRATVQPDAVPAMVATGRMRSRITRDGRRELLEVGER